MGPPTGSDSGPLSACDLPRSRQGGKLGLGEDSGVPPAEREPGGGAGAPSSGHPGWPWGSGVDDLGEGPRPRSHRALSSVPSPASGTLWSSCWLPVARRCSPGSPRSPCSPGSPAPQQPLARLWLCRASPDSGLRGALGEAGPSVPEPWGPKAWPAPRAASRVPTLAQRPFLPWPPPWGHPYWPVACARGLSLRPRLWGQ